MNNNAVCSRCHRAPVTSTHFDLCAQCIAARPAAEKFASSPEPVRLRAIEIERRWEEDGELWLVRPDKSLVRAEYDCDHCGDHVLDENYLRGYLPDPKYKQVAFERLCYACFAERTGLPNSPTTPWAVAAQARRRLIQAVALAVSRA